MIKKAKSAHEILQGSEEGYKTYRKYLAINFHFNKNMNALRHDGVRLAKCSREKYAANELQWVFERIARSMNPRDAEKLLVYYQLENQFPNCNKYINEYKVEDLLNYENVLRKLSYTVKGEMQMLWDMASKQDIFGGSPSKLTKMLHSRQIRPETYIYMSLAIDMPVSDDMVTSAILDTIRKYKPWLYYFTGVDEKTHKARAESILKDMN